MKSVEISEQEYEEIFRYPGVSAVYCTIQKGNPPTTWLVADSTNLRAFVALLHLRAKK